ncbi:hypothetical protein F4776DRAFT_663012 [Hypoxylon sp. NC0597]|nr:hypothetical protein F4776DRAFT_663012 [Hypoxylon sp. NC0597]
MEQAAGANRRGEIIIPTPRWFIALRVLQIVFALVNIALTGWWINALYYDELGFVIVCGLFTWVVAVYALLAEKVVSCRRAYNTWAILSLDGLMIIFWLAAMAATANRRGTFNISATATCVSDGSAINSGHCVYAKRDFASNTALGALSGIAGISALTMLLFVVTFAYVCHYFRLSFAADSTSDLEKASAAGVNHGGVAGGPGATELQGGISPQGAAMQQGNQQWAEQAGYPQQSAGQPQYQQVQTYDPYAPHNSPYNNNNAGAYPQ